MLGYPDQALIRSQEALALAQESSHAFSMGFALQYAAVLHQSRREVQLVQERAEAIIALAHEHGFVQWLAGGRCMWGWALIEQGKIEEGIAQLCQGMADWRAMGTDLARTHMLARLAEAYEKGGQIEEGLRILDEALALLHQNKECYYEVELYRLKGELLLQEGKRQKFKEVEESFLQAIDIARRQHAKSLELRAAMSLGRLWQRQGKRAEAHQVLTEICGWFTEGFDTLDVQEAKILLEALA
jgi:adenylate cyclase